MSNKCGAKLRACTKGFASYCRRFSTDEISPFASSLGIDDILLKVNAIDDDESDDDILPYEAPTHKSRVRHLFVTPAGLSFAGNWWKGVHSDDGWRQIQ